MIAQIELDSNDLKNILDSIHDVAQISKESYTDINMIVRQDKQDRIQIYFTEANRIQVLHEITEGDDISVTVSHPHEFVFSTGTLQSIIKRVRSGRLSLKFFEQKYAIRVGNDGEFATPTSLELRLFQETDFRQRTTIDNLHKVASVNRMSLLDNLDPMSMISKVVEFKISNSELWISVSDQVEGDGKVMKQTKSECDITDYAYRYQLTPLIEFLENLRTSEVEISVNKSGVLMIEGNQDSLASKLHLAPRVR